MDEKKIRLEAFDKMQKALMERFEEAFNDGFCGILKNNVNQVVTELKARENALN